jgi:hypothetical protein
MQLLVAFVRPQKPVKITEDHMSPSSHPKWKCNAALDERPPAMLVGRDGEFRIVGTLIAEAHARLSTVARAHAHRRAAGTEGATRHGFICPCFWCWCWCWCCCCCCCYSVVRRAVLISCDVVSLVPIAQSSSQQKIAESQDSHRHRSLST